MQLLPKFFSLVSLALSSYQVDFLGHILQGSQFSNNKRDILKVSQGNCVHPQVEI